MDFCEASKFRILCDLVACPSRPSFPGLFPTFSRGQCSLPFPQGLPIASSVISTFPGNTEEMAWDANLLTKWSSNCRQILGGCTPRSQWVGHLVRERLIKMVDIKVKTSIL